MIVFALNHQKFEISFPGPMSSASDRHVASNSNVMLRPAEPPSYKALQVKACKCNLSYASLPSKCLHGRSTQSAVSAQTCGQML